MPKLGPLENKDIEPDAEVLQRLTALTPDGVPIEASIMLYKNYMLI